MSLAAGGGFVLEGDLGRDFMEDAEGHFDIV